MSLWDKVKIGLEEGVMAVKDGATIIAIKTEEMARIAKMKYDIYTLNRKIEKSFTEIGARVYDLAQEEPVEIFDDDQVKKYIEDIKKYEKEIKEIETSIENIKSTKLSSSTG